MVAVSASLIEELHTLPVDASGLVFGRNGKVLPNSSWSLRHHRLCDEAGVPHITLHGLRHSFAVATLRDWYRADVAVAAKLPILSAYLGHAHPGSTYWYLSAAPDLLAAAAQRLDPAAGGPR